MFNTQAQKTALCQIDLSRTPEKQLKDPEHISSFKYLHCSLPNSGRLFRQLKDSRHQQVIFEVTQCMLKGRDKLMRGR